MQKKASFTPVSHVLGRLLGRLNLEESATMYAMSKAWTDIAGSEAAAHSCPDQVKSGCLFVAVDNPVWSTELGFRKPELSEKLVTAFPGLDIKEFRFLVKKFRFPR